MKTPKKIQIGPMPYKVKEVERLIAQTSSGDLGYLFGRILYEDRKIEIENDIDDLSKAVTLWHESVHGVLEHAGVVEQDESLVILLGYGIVQLIKDNPELVEYTLKALQK